MTATTLTKKPIPEPKRRHAIHDSAHDRVFDAVVLAVVILITLLIAYPLYFVIIASFSDPGMVATGQVLFWPRGITFDGYNYIFQDHRIWSGYLNTFIYTIFGTLLGIALTVPAAYALSRKDLMGYSPIMKIFVFTMYFSGGMVPIYLVISQLGLINTRFVLILVGSFSAYNLIICRTFFQNTIPLEIQEAAEIDGCSIPHLFVSIILPLSKPIIAIMALYYAVGHWNDFFNALLYINSQDKLPLQMIMRDILIQGQSVATDSTMDPQQVERMQTIAMSIKYGVIIGSSLPILAFYPFIQKYFVKGVMIGSVKG